MKKLLQILIYIALPVVVIVFLYRLFSEDEEVHPDYDFDNPDAKANPGDYSRAGVSKASVRPKKADVEMTKRQRELYTFIQSSGEAAMNQIKKRFNKVSSRTLRRDLSQLVDLDMITKRGTTRSTTYFAS
jgi:predicted HTH transcriptional regulator